MVFLFILQYLPFLVLKGETIMKECINELAPSHTKTAVCTHYIISNTVIPQVICPDLMFACTLLHCELHNICQLYNLDKYE